MSKKPNFQDLPFLSKLLTLRSALLEEHNGKEIIEFADELIEERDPFEELKERGALAYLGKFSNTPELLVNPTHRNHVAFQQLVEELDELSRSWELTAARLERFSSRYEKMFSEDSEFEPMYSSIKPKLNVKKVALFGSYGWGECDWMRDW